MTALVLVHGRSQQTAASLRGDAEQVQARVEAKKRAWLAGLAKGLVLAGLPPVSADVTYYPYYGNLFAERIRSHEAAGGARPDLEVAGPVGPVEGVTEDLVLESAQEIGFDPGSPPASPELESRLSGLLKSTVVRQALQFLSTKTGAPEWVIEGFLRDVAYYLELDDMREQVLDVVRADVAKAAVDHGDIVVVGHSLGSVVAYDLCQTLTAGPRVRLLVTAGSPLGQPIVQRNLRGHVGGGPPPVPPVGRPGATAWLNAYDVRDVVALIHPLAPRFAAGDRVLHDERTHNPSGPHSIEDYLSDRDVAGPIGRAMA